MVGTSDFFNDLLFQLRPSATELQRARKHRDEVQRRLALEGVVEFINTGSYIKGTAIRPFNDIDLFVGLDPGTYAKQKDRILTRLAWQLRFSYPASWVRIQEHSVGVAFATGVRVDVVPGFADVEDECYYIRNRITKEWVATNPHLHKDFFNTRQTEDARYRDVIRLVKHWKSHRRIRWGSYLMDLLVSLRLDEEGMPDGRDVALHAFFSWLTEQNWENEVYCFTDYYDDSDVGDIKDAPLIILDPANPASNVARSVTHEDLKELVNVADTARKRSAAAMRATSRTAAERIWREVLPWFPRP